MFDGPSYWRVIHYFAYHNKGRAVLQQLSKFIGCEKCRQHYSPPDDTQDLLEWSINHHNEINNKLGKPVVMSPIIKSTCDLCDTDTSSYNSYVWTFIHNAAETGKDDAFEFLKLVSSEYPCEHCRDTFFVDDPIEGETCLYWTLRHHKRINDAKNLPPFAYEMDPPDSINNTGACAGCAATQPTMLPMPKT